MSEPQTLREALAVPAGRKHHHHHSVMAQRGQLIRYLEHIGCRSREQAYREVEAMHKDTIRELYRLLRLCIDNGFIKWEGGRFV